MRYSLTIRRYNRYMKFDGIEELTEELKRYFTASEVASGIIDRLTHFTMKDLSENGFYYKHGENDYRDMKICCDDFGEEAAQ